MGQYGELVGSQCGDYGAVFEDRTGGDDEDGRLPCAPAGGLQGGEGVGHFVQWEGCGFREL